MFVFLGLHGSFLEALFLTLFHLLAHFPCSVAGHDTRFFILDEQVRSSFLYFVALFLNLFHLLAHFPCSAAGHDTRFIYQQVRSSFFGLCGSFL